MDVEDGKLLVKEGFFFFFSSMCDRHRKVICMEPLSSERKVKALEWLTQISVCFQKKPYFQKTQLLKNNPKKSDFFSCVVSLSGK